MSTFLPDGAPSDTTQGTSEVVPPRPHNALRVLMLAFCLAAMALPFLAVDIAPITDLPQQAAQIRLLQDAVGNPQSPYTVQWWEPNKLGYLPLWITGQLGEPLSAGRWAVWLIGICWACAAAFLARRRERSSASAVLACLFFFSHVLYWGLLNFLLGLPVFVLWLCLLTAKARPPTASAAEPRRTASFGHWLGLCSTACLLYSAHVLWLAAGGLALLAIGVTRRFDLRRWWIHGSALVPVAIATAVWYPKLAARGFDSETFWAFDQRWRPGWWINSAFGGLQGTTETWLAAFVVLWIVLGLVGVWQARRQAAQHQATQHSPEEGVDRLLLSVAAGAFAAALVLPAVYQNTVFFASRWLPVGAVFLVLAVPPPPLKKVLQRGLPLLLVFTLSIATLDAWLTFDRQELDGLHGILDAMAPDARVLGLDFVRTSESIQGYPYYHLYAWSQALHGGELARSFANEASSLVVYRDLPRQLPWTAGLDWRPRKLRQSDIPHFDYVVLHGDAEMHRFMTSDPRLRAISEPRSWSLFEVRPTTPPLAPLPPSVPD